MVYPTQSMADNPYIILQGLLKNKFLDIPCYSSAFLMILRYSPAIFLVIALELANKQWAVQGKCVARQTLR